MPSRRPVVLFVGHAASPTGFARVLRSLLEHLPDRYELHHFGIEAYQATTAVSRWTAHSNSDVSDIHNNRALDQVITAVYPDIVAVLDEPWVCSRRAPLLFGADRFRTVFYGAVDFEDAITPQIASDLARLDCFVAFTELGSHIVQNKVRTLVLPSLPRIEVIPHGVDTSVFYPLCKTGPSGFLDARRAARSILFSSDRTLDDAFIVLNANRNQPFKRIDLTIEGFALFAQGKPENVKLYLHMGSRRSAQGTTPLVDRFGIRSRVLSTTQGETHPRVSDAQLRLIYNACDVGINTSEKEGWGLVSFEHAATGAAQIVPKHSACAELWKNAAILLEPADCDSLHRYQKAGRTVTVEGVAAALERLYSDAPFQRELALAAFENATRAEYQWSNIGRKWDDLFQQLLSQRSRPRVRFG